MMKQKGIPFEDWPDLDLKLWRGAFAKSRRRSLAPCACNLSGATILGLKADYCCNLGWLQDRGLLDHLLLPSQRWPASRLDELADDLVASYTLHSAKSRLSRLSGTIRLLEPVADRRHLQKIIREFGRPRRTTHPPTFVTTADLLQLGLDQMDAAENMLEKFGMPNPSLYRAGLAIALMSMRVWRVGVFRKMRWDANLVKKGDTWRMQAKWFETKQKRDCDDSVPNRLVPGLDRYRSFYWPLLAKNVYRGDAVWLSRYSRPISPSVFYADFCRHTRERFGVSISPHNFRHIGATTIAVYNPEQIHIVPNRLGHNGSKVFEEHYNLADSLSASNDWNETIAELLSADSERRRLGGRGS